MSSVYLLRQYPASSHDRPIEVAAERAGFGVKRYEYDLSSNLGEIGDNVRFLADSLLRRRGERLVLGAEPFDPFVVLFERLAERHDVILHTSWPYWASEFVPQPPRFGWQRRRWEAFLKDVQAVGVTKAATDSVRRAGAGKAVNIPHAVDTKIFHPNRATLSRTETVVLYVGRLEPRKGVGEFADLIQDWDCPNIRFWFVGDGPLSGEISTLADRYGNVEYFGYITDNQELADIYASADIFALPSYRVSDWEELFGIVVIEALACGLPVVTTDCIGPAEIIDHGETGYVVEQHDTESLKERIAELAASPEKRQRLSERAREVAVNQFDLNTVAGQWERILEL